MSEEASNVETLRSQWTDDAKLIAGVVVATYVAFFLLGAVAGLSMNEIVGEFRRITMFAAIYALAALALNLHWGYTGLFNIGLMGFMAIGVYTMAVLTAPVDGSPAGLGLPLVVGIFGGMLVTAVVGGLVALPALRLRADYFAIVTLGFSEIVRLGVTSGSLQNIEVGDRVFGTGGGRGIRSPSTDVVVDYVLYADYMLFDPDRAGGPNLLGEILYDVAAVFAVRPSVVRGFVYAFVLICVVVLFFLVLTRVGYSPFGRVLKAIREDELAARSLGKDTRRTKIVVFMFGCALLALVGMLWQGRFSTTNPDQFLPIFTFYVFVALIIGGSGSNTGAVVGGFAFAAFLYQGPRYLRTVVNNLVDLESPQTIYDAVLALGSFDVGAFLGYFVNNLDEVRFVFVGVVLIVLMIRRPEGFLGHRKEIAAATNLSRRSAATDGGSVGTIRTGGPESGDSEPAVGDDADE